MSLSSSRSRETWIPTPAGLGTIASALRAIRGASWSQLAAVGLFVALGLVAVLIAAIAGGPAFDYGGILGAAG